MRKFMLIGLAVFATVILAACGSKNAGLGGTAWHLTAITEKVPAYQGVVPASEQSKFTITFDSDGTFDATADCNQVAGTYTTTSSGGLTITLGPSTLVACPNGSYADLYVHALGQAASYAIANEQLTITLQDGGTLTFDAGPAPASSASAGATATANPTAATTPKPTPSPTPKPTAAPTPKPTAAPTSGPTSAPTTAPTPPPTPKPTAAPPPTPTPGSDLTGRAWQLTAITTQDPAFHGVVPVADQSKYTVTFDADGTFAATADCNTVSGTWTAIASGGLIITPGASTIVACADGSLSDLYVLALSNAASYAIANEQLTITLADAGTLVYR